MPIDPTQNHDAEPQDAPEGFRAAFAEGDDTEGHLRLLAEPEGDPDGIMTRADGDDAGDGKEGFRQDF